MLIKKFSSPFIKINNTYTSGNSCLRTAHGLAPQLRGQGTGLVGTAHSCGPISASLKATAVKQDPIIYQRIICCD